MTLIELTEMLTEFETEVDGANHKITLQRCLSDAECFELLYRVMSWRGAEYTRRIKMDLKKDLLKIKPKHDKLIEQLAEVVK